MSSGLMETGGEQTGYEDALTENVPAKKSGGQMGQPSTTENPSNTDAAAQQKADRGEQTAENIRYGQSISEGGMGGMTSNQGGEAAESGYGRVKDAGSEDKGGAEERRQAGYGGSKDMDREIGA